MSDEKIDLADIEAITRQWYGSEHPVLALVRVARVARVYANSGHVAHRLELEAELAAFTDSAEVPGG